MNKIIHVYTPDEDLKASEAVAQDTVDQIRVLSGILFRLLDQHTLVSDTVDLNAAWDLLKDLWDAEYIVKRADE